MSDSTIRSVIDLTPADVLAANMEALGLKPSPSGETADRVWQASRNFIAEHKRIPSASELSSGVGVGASRVRQVLQEMAQETPPRMLRVRSATGQNSYMPKVI